MAATKSTIANVAAAAAQAAALQQQRPLATLSDVKGPMVTLVAAAREWAAQQAFGSVSVSGRLDFAPSRPPPAPLAQTAAALQISMAQVGKPYVWGGAGPDVFDCSGLLQWSWAHTGVAIPRVAADQQRWTEPVPISQVQPGDLIFFGDPAHHVGMYIGTGMMVEAPHSGATVEVVPIWWDQLTGFGRVHQ